MARGKKADNGREPTPRYWTVPKIPVGLKMDKDLIDRAKAVAKKRKITFTRLVAQGIERELTEGR